MQHCCWCKFRWKVKVVTYKWYEFELRLILTPYKLSKCWLCLSAGDDCISTKPIPWRLLPSAETPTHLQERRLDPWLSTTRSRATGLKNKPLQCHAVIQFNLVIILSWPVPRIDTFLSANHGPPWPGRPLIGPPWRAAGAATSGGETGGRTWSVTWRGAER